MKNEFYSKPDTRILTRVFIIIGIFVAACFLFAYYKEKGADMYIVPSDFKGKATVYFDQPNGIPEKLDGERRVFEIPTSGTLYTQSPYKEKWSSYYQTTSNGKLDQLIDGNARTANGTLAYKDVNDVWVENTDFIHIDTEGHKQHIAIFTVERK